ncbi:glycosyltransferase family 2 protein [Vibrio sinaloensis]|uniref:Glycosyltransferase n=1 Tax=Photobacterium sp. (strain ATCC 43367) TaxID=379097 RepID=A0A0A5HVF7_PHOS4|nr:glycosyltransferase family 2 protein [Vibrio sinaloensis]KGY07469.1 glycosyltransferase [Vibrio sinaloensis]KHT52271.1 glycosyltransferase [Vibrio sinaloensis]
MITGVVITLNESKNIVECIQSLQQVCSEVVVVDSNSVDDTRELAEQAGAKVVIQSYLGDGFQKNVGLDHTDNHWILSLDADERLTDEMVAAIKNLDLTSTKHDAFAFRRRNYIGSRWIKQCGWYPDFCIRLYDKTQTRFAEVKQHAAVQAKNPERISADIIHFSFENLGQLFAKPGRDFSGRAAKIMYQKGKRVNALSPFLHGLNAFIKSYIIKKGFMGGADGLTVSISASLSSYLKYARLLEFQRDPKVLEKEDFNKVW